MFSDKVKWNEKKTKLWHLRFITISSSSSLLHCSSESLNKDKNNNCKPNKHHLKHKNEIEDDDDIVDQPWIDIKDLPSRLRLKIYSNQNDNQDYSTTIQQRQPRPQHWYQRIRYDLGECRRFTFIQINIIWFTSLIILLLHLRNCNSSSSNNRDKIIINKLICQWLIIIVSLNFSISIILLIILQFYICHIVRIFSKIPWLFIEMFLSIWLLATIFLSSMITTCLITGQTLIILLSWIQLMMTTFYCKLIVIHISDLLLIDHFIYFLFDL